MKFQYPQIGFPRKILRLRDLVKNGHCAWSRRKQKYTLPDHFFLHLSFLHNTPHHSILLLEIFETGDGSEGKEADLKMPRNRRIYR